MTSFTVRLRGGCLVGGWRGLGRWSRLYGRRTLGWLIDICFRRIRKPEISVMPEHDAQSQQKQTERSRHQGPLPGIFGRPSSQWPGQGAVGFGHDGLEDRHAEIWASESGADDSGSLNGPAPWEVRSSASMP